MFLNDIIGQLNETELKDLADYQAKRKALQDIQLDPHTHKDPELSAELVRRKSELERQATERGYTNEDKQRLDPKCWTGYKKQGTKMKGDVRVNNCVPAEESAKDPGISKDKETQFHAKLDHLVHDTFGKRDDEMPAKEGRDWDEGNREPANNFAITINGRKWKVFQGNGYYADDEREMKQYYKLQDWCRRKSEQTGKQWEVYRTGAPATESVSEGGPFSYGKSPRKGSVADLAAKKRKEQDKNKAPIEPKDQRVGVAKVTKDVAEAVATMDREYQLVQQLGALGQRIVQNPKLWNRYSEENDSGDPDWIISLIQDGTGATFQEVLRLSDLFSEIGGGLGRIIDFAWAVKEGDWENDFLRPYITHRKKNKPMEGQLDENRSSKYSLQNVIGDVKSLDNLSVDQLNKVLSIRGYRAKVVGKKFRDLTGRGAVYDVKMENGKWYVMRIMNVYGIIDGWLTDEENKLITPGRVKPQGVAEGVDEKDIINSGMPLKYIEQQLQQSGLEKDIRYFIRWAIDNGSSHIEDAIELGNKAQRQNPEISYGLHKLKQYLGQGVAENAQLSIQQLATISDEALDKAYGYGRSTPGNTFGWQANLMSAAYAKKMIDAGVTDIEKISDAIHKGWNVTAQKFVQDPDQFGDTEKLRQAGKLEAKLQQRAKLMKIDYAQLDNDEQEKDRVVARALLQSIKGQQDVTEAVGGNYLYHATGGLKSILQSGAIDAAKTPQVATQAQSRLPTVSATRDWGYASGSHAQSQGVGIGRHAVIVLDRNAVENHFKTLATSQSQDIRGAAYNPSFRPGGQAAPQGTNKTARAMAKGKFTTGTAADPETKALYTKSKSGGEFEEAIVVPKGSLPIQGNMVGFWVNPESPLMQDPEVMNHPLRLERSKNQFVKANQGVAEAKSLTKRVRVVKGPDAGKTGWIREIKHGAFKGAPKAYYVDLDDGSQANNLPGSALRLIKDKQSVAEEKKGLYYYVNKRKAAGTSRPAGHPKAPTAQAWKDAAKTAKKEDVNESYDLEVRLMEMRLAGYQV